MLPLGKVFVPFGIKSSLDSSNRPRVTSFDSITTGLCDLAAGEALTMRAESEVTIKTSGLLGLTSRLKKTQESKCRVAKDPRPDSELGPSIGRGNLEATCAHVNADGKASESRTSYMLASRYDLANEEIAGFQTTTIACPSATYAGPEWARAGCRRQSPTARGLVMNN